MLLGGTLPSDGIPADWRAAVIWMNSIARKFVCFGWGLVAEIIPNYITRTDCFAVQEDISGSNQINLNPDELL